MLTFSPQRTDHAEALRYMGWFGKPDSRIEQIITTAEQMLNRSIRPMVIYRVLPLHHQEQLQMEGLTLPGRDICAHLNGCSQVILFAATLSAGADLAINRAKLSDLTLQLAMDALANVQIEAVCDSAEEIFRQEFPEKYFTWRFSPGYGDLPLSLQPALLQHLDAQKRVGLTVTPENILIPRKSVTALIGLSDTPLERRRQGCALCQMHDRCLYRKRGIHCE